MQVHCAVIDLTVINRDFVDLLLLQFIQWLLELTQSIMSDFVVKHQLDAASCGMVSVGGGGGGGGHDGGFGPCSNNSLAGGGDGGGFGPCSTALSLASRSAVSSGDVVHSLGQVLGATAFFGAMDGRGGSLMPVHSSAAPTTSGASSRMQLP
mmetsp:Transcript_37904/g.69085  ORF Transcript_37904/g.69085 Transcript_37904/m.69085 type:complete len:152 (-) Transcript_37904:469-924(-)